MSRFSNGDGEGQVLLLQSTDAAPYDLYHGRRMWVTIALNGWPSKAEVQYWCQQNWPTLHASARETVDGLQPTSAAISRRETRSTTCRCVNHATSLSCGYRPPNPAELLPRK